MRRRDFLKTTAAAVSAPTGPVPAAQRVGDRFNWYRNSAFIIHYDHHIFPEDRNVGGACDPDQYRRYLEDVKPDFIQYISKGEPGYAAYPTRAGVPAPELKRDIFRVLRGVTNELGMKLVAYYSGLGDELAAEQHPEWCSLDADGRPLKPNMCPNREYVNKRMIPMFGELMDWYQIDGFWTDDDVWRVGYCWCPECREGFRKETGEAAPSEKSSPLWTRFAQFQRDSFSRYLKKIADFVRSKNPNCLYASNWAYTVRQPESPPAFLERISGDIPHYTPSAHWASFEARFWTTQGIASDIMVADHIHYRQRNLYPLLSYTKPAVQFKREAATCLANGARLTVWQVPNPDGSLVKSKHKLIGEVSRFVRARKDFCLGTSSAADVVVLHSPLTHYMAGNGLFERGSVVNSIKGAQRALVENHFHCDLMNEEHLVECIGKYRLVVLAEQVNLSQRMISALRDYVDRGGGLVATGLTSAFVDGLPQTQLALSDVFGVELVKRNAMGPFWIATAEETVIFDQDYHIVRPRGARVSARFLRSYHDDPVEFSDYAAVTDHRFGKGRAAYFAADVFRWFAEAPYPATRGWLGDVFTQIVPGRRVDLEGPAYVEVTLRSRGDELVLHLVNQGSVGPETDSDEYHAVDELPMLRHLRARVEMAQQPREVVLMPGEEAANWHWREGQLQVDVPELHIHRAVRIRK